MIDEDYWSLAPYLDGVCKNVKAATSENCGCPSGTLDPELVKATKTKHRVLVTLDDSTIKRRDYPPCTHGGIIFIQSKSLREDAIKRIFRIFCLSNEIDHVVGHLTYLYRDRAIIFTHNEKIIIRWYVSNRRRGYKIHRQPRGKNDPMLL
jgi:hypothetical protein